MNKPTPVSKWIVCSVCDLDWNAHGPNPTLMNCISLLKARNVTQPYPWHYQWRDGIRYYGNSSSVTLGSNMANTITADSNSVEYRTPKED